MHYAGKVRWNTIKKTRLMTRESSTKMSEGTRKVSKASVHIERVAHAPNRFPNESYRGFLSQTDDVCRQSISIRLGGQYVAAAEPPLSRPPALPVFAPA